MANRYELLNAITLTWNNILHVCLYAIFCSEKNLETFHCHVFITLE